MPRRSATSKSWPDVATLGSDVEQEAGDITGGRGEHRMRRRALRREQTVSSTGSADSGAETPSHQPESSGSPSTHSTSPVAGDDSSGEPPAVKLKQRRRIWDSFLYKTRKIRIRKKDKDGGKLDKRASSQPNIPTSTRISTSSSGPEENPEPLLPNGKSQSFREVDTPTSRKSRSILRRRENLKTRVSSSSLNDSNYESAGSLATEKRINNNRLSDVDANMEEEDDNVGEDEEEGDDNVYEDNEFVSPLRQNSNSAKRTFSDPLSSPETGGVPSSSSREVRGGSLRRELSHSHSGRVNFSEDVSFDTEVADMSKEDEVPVIEQTEEDANQDSSLLQLHPRLTRQHSFFMLNIHLREGRDLVIRDSCGTSDPYVKFKVGNKLAYKSRTILKNLNPRWDEQFTIPVEDITKPVTVKVYDYDRAWNDDPMGGADIDVASLDVNKETELKLLLSERGKEEYMGYVLLSCTLVPKTDEEKDQLFRRSMRSSESARKMKLQPWTGMVNIVLVEGNGLVPMDDNGLSDPYVKFRLGTEKYRSKFKSKTLCPRWLEQFDLRLYDDQSSHLEITVYDHDTRGKDDFMGRAEVDLSQLEKERTHVLEQQLEDGAGTLKLLLTISGTLGSEMSSDLANYTPNALLKNQIVHRYNVSNSFSNMTDIGHFEVKVFRAHGLQSADFGGLSDPFCVLELVNDRVQTQTEYKTLNPEWAKVFTFPVKDIHSVLEVTVYDEDRNKKVEFLGKIAIPLLRVRNGERRWYALKDRKLMHKTKGAVLLEMDFVFNQLKAAVRTVNPREEKLMKAEQKFKISIMKQNINRVSELIGTFIDTGRFIQSCFDWQSPARTITAFIVYLVIVWNFELYMLPISLLLVLLKNLVVAQIVGGFKKEPVEEDYFDEEEEEDDEDKDKTEEKKSIVERYHAIQEVCLTVQQGLDTVACLGERVKNTFNWSVPWLSTFAVIVLVIGMTVLFYIPLRFLLLAWGINKFTKKLRKPNAIPNNELLDFLSRVPSDNEMLQFRELRPDIPANTSTTKKKRS
ncbi:multiple C2 and transmembrane domain-containing protein 1 isoform X2 [Aplysia californica]|uniref:Multiple C2 and transmembrane domain-containing protein 1 isoform X2 n=1 Tax=Aplysia californica TaxID=6500 RepID=A0ABM1VRA6_APLCA|nr:multiple C2 and transmembrane domain-containing protein 1 isoform X2 [Aplysia californica]